MMSMNYADAVRGKNNIKPSAVECLLCSIDGGESPVQSFDNEVHEQQLAAIGTDVDETSTENLPEQPLEPRLQEKDSLLYKSLTPNNEESDLSTGITTDEETTKTRELPKIPPTAQGVSVSVSLVFSLPVNEGKTNSMNNLDGKKPGAQGDGKKENNNKSFKQTEEITPGEENNKMLVDVESLAKNVSQLWKLATQIRGRHQSDPWNPEYTLMLLYVAGDEENENRELRLTLDRACDLLDNLSRFVDGLYEPSPHGNDDKESLEEYYANGQIRLSLSQNQIIWVNASDLILDMYLQFIQCQRITKYLERFCNLPTSNWTPVNEKITQPRKHVQLSHYIQKMDKSLDRLTNSILNHDLIPELQSRWKKLYNEITQQDEQVAMENTDMKRMLMSQVPDKESILNEWIFVSPIIESDRRGGISPSKEVKKSLKPEIPKNENNRSNHHYTNSIHQYPSNPPRSQQYPPDASLIEKYQHQKNDNDKKTEELNIDLSVNDPLKKNRHLYNGFINRDSNSRKLLKNNNPYNHFCHDDSTVSPYSNPTHPSFNTYKKPFKTDSSTTKKKRKPPILQQQLLFPIFKPMPPIRKLIITLTLISLLAFFFFLLFSIYSS